MLPRSRISLIFFTKSQEILGGKLDFVLHSIGMSPPNIRKGKEYGDMNYEWYLKTLDISALSFHKNSTDL